MSLRSKESKLAGYIRKDIKCSMDASTTSPSESQNNFTKHHDKSVNSKMNISKSLPTLLSKNDRRMKRNNDNAMRELASNNLSSCAPTKTYLNKKGQGLADRYFDISVSYKSARVGPKKFLVWNFDLVKEPEQGEQLDVLDPIFAQPLWCRVNELELVVRSCGALFMKCSCGVRSRIGVPCACFWKCARDSEIPNESIMDVGMFDVRWMKIYRTHYDCTSENGDHTSIAEKLFQAQELSFNYEGCGTHISTEFGNKLLSVHTENTVYPILGKDTSQEDLNDALWVQNRSKGRTPIATTWMDLYLHKNCAGDDDESLPVKETAKSEYREIWLMTKIWIVTLDMVP